MVDNFKEIREYLFKLLESYKEDNDTEDIILPGRIIRRKKENPYKESEYIVKRYYFKNEQQLIDAEEEIKELCKMYNARFYLSVNFKSIKDVAYDISIETPKLIRSGQYWKFKRIFDSTVDSNKGVKELRRWIFDIDDPYYFDDIILFLHNNKGNEHVDTVFKTLNGYHIIVKPHDTRYIDKGSKNTDDANLILPKNIIDVKKNAMTLVYYSESNNE